MQQIAIFASGSGSNALKIIEHFQGHTQIRVGLVVSNKSDAGVLQIAREHNIPNALVSKAELHDKTFMDALLGKHQIRFIALAGFLMLIPPHLIASFPNKILNIHPALLPKFGGKGMYGRHVHQAVRTANEMESGITIHFVNEQYDAGDIIKQVKCTIEPTDTVDDITQKVQKLEHQYYPQVIASLLESIAPDVR